MFSESNVLTNLQVAPPSGYLQIKPLAQLINLIHVHALTPDVVSEQGRVQD
jgi:hypothetical protein